MTKKRKEISTGITELFKLSVQRLMEEDILRRADLMTLASLKEVETGLYQPIEDLLETMEKDQDHHLH